MIIMYNEDNSPIKYAYRRIKYDVLERGFKGISSPFRKSPDFLVIGGKRCGTTTLYEFLKYHPDISEPPFDHMGFFDDNYKLGFNYYRSFFPLKTKKNLKKMNYDVTTSYLTSPYVPERIHKHLPHIKMIILLRNPIDRAWSEYNSNLKNDKKYGNFEMYIDNELKDLEKSDYSKKIQENNYNLFDVSKNYIKKGLYYYYIKKWFGLFPKRNFCILPTETFARDERYIYEKIFEFLEIPYVEIKNTKRMEKGSYTKIDDIVRKKLNNFFTNENEKLFKLLNQRFDW